MLAEGVLMPANPLFCIRLTVDERQLLEQLAEREAMSVPDMFRKCLKWYAANVQPASVRKVRPKSRATNEP